MIYDDFAPRFDAIAYPSAETHPDRDERNEARRAYTEQRSDLATEFQEALAEEYLDGIPAEQFQAVAAAVYRMAYAEGHSEGFRGVENFYMELVDVAFAGFRAGQAAAV